MTDQERSLQMLAMERRKYAESWSKTAEHNDSSGSYEWMAGFLDGYSKVLEIGVGDGLSTKRLLDKGHTVVGIDTNIECLRRAQARLGGAASVRLVEREAWTSGGSGLVVHYDAIVDSLNGANVLLVQGDIIADPELLNWLDSLAPFDAVACWLIGTNSVDLARHQLVASDYRCSVQNRVYELADSLLRSQGIVHVVDRCEAPTERSIAGITSIFIESQEEQASVTSLVVDASSARYHLWEDPAGGIGMTLGSGSANCGLNLISAISHKP